MRLGTSERREEQERIWDADLSGTTPHASDASTIPSKNRQGALGSTESGAANGTNYSVSGRWKNEELLELELESQTDSDARTHSHLPFFLSPKPQPKQMSGRKIVTWLALASLST